jgi:hypothetical protein
MVLATPVATDAASEVASEKTLAAPLVTSEIIDAICAEARVAAMNGRKMVEGRIV